VKNFFLRLVEDGKIESASELKTVYRRFVKRYHPDSRPAVARDVDFDELRRDYRAAAALLESRAGPMADGARGPAFEYDAEKYVGELRDLVARGLPVNPRAVERNREYGRSIEYVSACMALVYGDSYSFADLDRQLASLKERVPNVLYYAREVLWSGFDYSAGYPHMRHVAQRHLDWIRDSLDEMGLSSLRGFLEDFIEIAGKVASARRRAAGASPGRRRFRAS